jgi:hypothetical protein
MTFGSGDLDKAGRAELVPPSRANRAMPITLLRCRLVDGGIDNFTALHLGRSIHYCCQGLYHVWVDIVIVSLCIGFVVPQADCSDICSVWTGECNFVLKTVLFTQ